MPIRKFRPTSDGRRNASGYTFEELTKKEPEKSLLATKTRTNGRGWGKISTRHRGASIAPCTSAPPSTTCSSRRRQPASCRRQKPELFGGGGLPRFL